MITLQRVYDQTSGADRPRFLVERLWPRGVKKSALEIDAWIKEVAPSAKLRSWFAHDPAKWQEFRRRYFEELNANPGAWAGLLDAARRGNVTLVFSSRDTEHNNAVALRDYLQAKLKQAGRTTRRPTRKAA